MNKNYSSIVLNILSPFRENLINNVAILCQSSIKKSSSKMLVVFLMFLAMTSGQKLLAKNTPNRFFNTNLSIKNDLLASSVAEGRGGGGGHGNCDWVGWHPLDASTLDVLSEILNTKDYNNKNILNTLFNPIL